MLACCPPPAPPLADSLVLLPYSAVRGVRGLFFDVSTRTHGRFYFDASDDTRLLQWRRLLRPLLLHLLRPCLLRGSMPKVGRGSTSTRAATTSAAPRPRVDLFTRVDYSHIRHKKGSRQPTRLTAGGVEAGSIGSTLHSAGSTANSAKLHVSFGRAYYCIYDGQLRHKEGSRLPTGLTEGGVEAAFMGARPLNLRPVEVAKVAPSSVQRTAPSAVPTAARQLPRRLLLPLLWRSTATHLWPSLLRGSTSTSAATTAPTSTSTRRLLMRLFGRHLLCLLRRRLWQQRRR